MKKKSSEHYTNYFWFWKRKRMVQKCTISAWKDQRFSGGESPCLLLQLTQQKKVCTKLLPCYRWTDLGHPCSHWHFVNLFFNIWSLRDTQYNGQYCFVFCVTYISASHSNRNWPASFFLNHVNWIKVQVDALNCHLCYFFYMGREIMPPKYDAVFCVVF